MNETEIQELRARLRGDLITPGNAAYEAARKVNDTRHAQVKREYDPGNLLRVDQNIEPA